MITNSRNYGSEITNNIRNFADTESSKFDFGADLAPWLAENSPVSLDAIITKISSINKEFAALDAELQNVLASGYLQQTTKYDCVMPVTPPNSQSFAHSWPSELALFPMDADSGTDEEDWKSIGARELRQQSIACDALLHSFKREPIPLADENDVVEALMELQSV